MVDRLNAYADWLRANKDKAGSPEFVKVADAYRQLRQQGQAQPTQPEEPGLLQRGVDMVNRAGLGLVTGPADLTAYAGNKLTDASNWIDRKSKALARQVPGIGQYVAPDNVDDGTRLPYAGPALRSALGVPEQSANASLPERALETATNVLFAHKMTGTPITAASVAKPTAGIEAGGELGEMVGGEDGRMVGSILGGGGASIAAERAGSLLRPFGAENAGDVYDAAQRLGVRVTAGQVGDGGAKWLEKSIGAVPWMGLGVNRAREEAAAGLRNVRDRVAADVNGGMTPDASPGVMGSFFREGAERADDRIQGRLSAQQEALEQAIGSDTPVNVRPVQDTLASMAQGTDDQGAAGLLGRLGQLNSMAPGGATARFATGPFAPLMNSGGPGPSAVPYGVVKDFRSHLGRDMDGQPALEAHQSRPVYGALTDAMEETANARGQGDQFRAANEAYSDAQPTLDSLRRVAGKKDVKGERVNPMDDVRAETYLRRLARTRAGLEPYAESFTPEDWGGVAGPMIARLGQRDRAEFRPDNMAIDLGHISDEGLASLTQNSPNAFGELHDAGTLGRAYNIPQQSEGLSRAIGGLTMAGTIGSGVYSALGPTGLPLMLAPGFALESGPVVRGLAGRSIPTQELANQNRAGLTAGVVNGLYGVK